MEQGFLFAVPAFARGSELGEQWHRAGNAKSPELFDDFIAAAEWLISARTFGARSGRDWRWLERWPARRRRDYPTPRPVSRCHMSRSAARYERDTNLFDFAAVGQTNMVRRG